MYRLIDGLYRVLRPAVFDLTDPEQAHEMACRAIEYLGQDEWLAQRYADVVWRLGGCEQYQNELGQTVGGVYFPGCFGAPAGFDKTGEIAHLLRLFGYGFAEAGTFVFPRRRGNPGMRLIRFPEERGLINRFGWNCPGAYEAARNLRNKARSVPVGGNIGPTPGLTSSRLAIESLVSVAEVLGPLVEYLVINLSCCNVEVVDFQDPILLQDLVRELRRGLPEIKGKPLFVKLKPETSHDGLDLISAVCIEEEVGLVIGNTFGTLGGAVSGRMLYQGVPGKFDGLPDRISATHQATAGLVPLIACGGVETAKQVYEVILRGAHLVQGLTGWIYGGPFWPREIADGVSRLIKRDGYSNISEARGKYTGR